MVISTYLTRARRMGMAAILFVLAASVSPLTLAAQQSAVYDQLVKISEVLINQGYSKSHDFEVDYLNESETDDYTITLTKGVTYKIVAVCDNDCEDIDLCIWDENGNRIDCDESEDDYPVLEVTPRWTGEFSFRVTMYDCGNNPCYFGIGVFTE